MALINTNHLMEVRTATSTSTATRLLVVSGVGLAAVVGFFFIWNFWTKAETAQPAANTKSKVTAAAVLAKHIETSKLATKTLVTSTSSLSQKQKAAADRLVALRALAESNPMAIIDVALPAEVRADLITEGVSATMLEERVDPIEAPYESEHNATLDADGNMASHNARNFFVLADGTEQNFEIPGYEIPYMHGSTLAITDGVKLDGTVYAAKENLTVTNEVLPGHTVKKVVAIAYRYDGQAPSTVTLDDRLRKPVFTDIRSTRKYYLENSFGQLVLNGKVNAEIGDIYGEYSIPTSTACSYSAIRTAVMAQATAAGVDLSGYDYYVMSGRMGAACQLAGYSGNTFSDPNTRLPGGFLAHEMGHMFGVTHVNGYMCMDTATTDRVPLSGNCVTDTYGTGWDVMGGSNDPNGVGHMVEYHKVRLNWLPIANVPTVTTSGSYTIAPIEQLVSGPMAIRIPRLKNSSGATTQWFSLQYHQPFGDLEGHFAASDPHFNGIMVHLNGTGFSDTGMLDMDPEGITGTYVDAFTGQTKYKAFLETGFTNYTLKLNQTFTDAVSGVSIKPTSLTAAGATIEVTFGTGTCVRGNPGVTLSPATQWGYAGLSKAYSLTLTNTDSPACTTSTFNVTPSVPAGWTVAPTSLTESLAPGVAVTRTINLTAPADAAEAFYNFSLTATNTNVATSTTTASATYVVQAPDTIAPTVNISSPSNGATLKGKNFKVQSSASDSSGVAKIEIFIDGVSKQVCLNVYSCTYNSTLATLTTGNHTISVTAIDASPNANTATTSITVKK